MSDETGKQLWGALKLTRTADSIGLALFRRAGGNATYAPEMDPFFKISDFLDFTSEAQYCIGLELPSSLRGQIFNVGDPTPIPYWVRGECFIISGDAEPRDVFRDHGAEAATNEVLRDLRQFLDNARNGVYREEQERWQVREIAAHFQDIFHEIPVHSSYWIRRLGDAVRYARTQTTPPHPIDDELRRVAMDWIERFVSKTDYDRIMNVVDNLLQGAIPPERAQSMIFAFLINKVTTGKFSDIEKKISRDRRFQQLFPDGLFRYWLTNNWPFLPFNYRKPRDILDCLHSEIAAGSRKKDFHRAERLSYLLFGLQDAPGEINDAILPFINQYWDRLSTEIEKSRSLFDDPREKGRWQERASRLLYLYHMLMSLDGIVDGKHRLSRAIIEGRFDMSTRSVRELEQIAEL